MRSSMYLILFCLFLQKKIHAQSSIFLGPQLGLASNFSRSSNIGFGASVEYINRFSQQIGFRGTVGYNYFKGKYFNNHVSFLPVRIGLQSFLSTNVFVLADAGIVAYNDNNNDSKTGFSYSVGAGYNIPLDTKKFVQLSANYNFFRYASYLNYTWFNFRAAYSLSWGKRKATME